MYSFIQNLVKQVHLTRAFQYLRQLTVWFLLSTGSTICLAGEVEVLHFWTSPGEAKSVEELKALMAQRGHKWKDFSVVGGGGQNAMIALRSRVLAGNPPAAVSIKGPAIQEWAKLNSFANLDFLAIVEKWDRVLPQVVQDQVKYNGHYIAVPVNIHRVNWMWSNSDILKKSGVEKIPSSFEEFLVAVEKIKAKGYIALAHGGQPWQDFILFEAVVLGVNGADFYKRAFIKLEPTALSGPEMQKALETYRKLKPYTDENSKNRDWNATTDLVIRSKAGFQFMGDWAKGEFLVAGQKPGLEFNCSPTPGTAGVFTYVVDTFAMFQLKSWEAQKAQGYLAFVLLSEEFQKNFNLRKGSIPARSDIKLDKFDDCARSSKQAFNVASNSASLVPSIAVDMAASTEIQAELRAAISDFWNNEKLTTNTTMARFVKATHK
jgi:glucose/mannose transport system substrate-binding protein